MTASLTDQAIEFLEALRWPMLPSCGTQKKPRSLVFGQKQRAGVQEVATAPDGSRRLVTVRKDHGAPRTMGSHPKTDALTVKKEVPPSAGE